MEAQLAGPERASQSGDKLASKYLTEHLYRKKEAITRANPRGLINGESSGRNDAVNMRMKLQVLPPCMKDAQEADMRAQMAWVCRYLLQCGGAGTKQQIVNDALVLLSKYSELVGNCEDNMRVRNRQKLFASFGQPLLAGTGLTTWTMSVAARIIRNQSMTTLRTTVEMTAQSCGSAALNREQHFQLRPCQ